MVYSAQGRVLNFDAPMVMGIVNITTDSFYSESRADSQNFQEKIDQYLAQGADVIDIGGASSRPGAALSDPQDEWAKIKSAIAYAVSQDAIVSVDTYHASVAEQAIHAGVHIINDISSGSIDVRMLDVITRDQPVYVAMHMRGTPESMQTLTDYEDVALDVLQHFVKLQIKLKEKGFTQLITDPGFGFSKTVEQNYTLFNHLTALHALEVPILIGVSRKSMIYKLQDLSPEEALPGSLGLAMLALQKGVSILRVHDVKETKQIIKVFNALKTNSATANDVIKKQVDS